MQKDVKSDSIKIQEYNYGNNYTIRFTPLLDKLEVAGYNKNAFNVLIKFEMFNTLEHLANVLIDYNPTISTDVLFYEGFEDFIIAECKKNIWHYINKITELAMIGSRFLEMLPYAYNIYEQKNRTFIPHYKDYAGYVLENTWLSISSYSTCWNDLKLDCKQLKPTFEGKLEYPFVGLISNFERVFSEPKYANERILKGKTEKISKRGRKSSKQVKVKIQGNGTCINSQVTGFVYSKYNNYEKPYNVRFFNHGVIQVIGCIRTDKADFLDVITSVNILFTKLGLTKCKVSLEYSSLLSRNIVSNILQPFKVKMCPYTRDKDLLKEDIHNSNIVYKFNIPNVNTLFKQSINQYIVGTMFNNEKSDNCISIQFTNLYKKSHPNWFKKFKDIMVLLYPYKINFNGTFAVEEVLSIHKFINLMCKLYFKDYIQCDLDALKKNAGGYYRIRNVSQFVDFVTNHFTHKVIDSDSD
jgi:hypothetical protein